jgi:hypothetical protein
LQVVWLDAGAEDNDDVMLALRMQVLSDSPVCGPVSNSLIPLLGFIIASLALHCTETTNNHGMPRASSSAVQDLSVGSNRVRRVEVRAFLHIKSCAALPLLICAPVCVNAPSYLCIAAGCLVSSSMRKLSDTLLTCKRHCVVSQSVLFYLSSSALSWASQ